VDVVRGGPGLGNIAPEQSDFTMMTKGGGHGNYRNIVLAPASVQEMCDLTVTAFDLADRYRNPAVILTDGFTGQMMEPLEIVPGRVELPGKPWAVAGTAATRKNLISSIFLAPDELEAHVRKLERKYALATRDERRSEGYRVEDAEILLVGYGIVSRVLRSAVDQARERGIRAGLFRPISLWPFPAPELRNAAGKASSVMVVELSTGQLTEEIRLSLEGSVPVEHFSRVGGNVPSIEEVLEHLPVTERSAA
jgi:pyruvate/2-oxoacid:ferredoxin oxidoreductase alpha subunit